MAALATLLILGGDPALAGDSPGAGGSEIDSLVRSADLVFRGSVRSVQHRSSEPNPEQRQGTPYTFVTYEVAQVMKGAVEGDRITLRFIGGPFDDDRFLVLPENPLFDIGDTDLLMVTGNVETPCPLVSCSTGRFRMIQDFVVNELGQRVQVQPGALLVTGPQMRFDEVTTHDMSPTIHLKRVESDAAGENGPPTPQEIQAEGTLDPERDLTPEQFSEYVAAAIVRSHTPEELAQARSRPARSADATLPFVVAPFAAVPAPEPFPSQAEATPGSVAAPGAFEAVVHPSVHVSEPRAAGTGPRATSFEANPERGLLPLALALATGAASGWLGLLAYRRRRIGARR